MPLVVVPNDGKGRCFVWRCVYEHIVASLVLFVVRVDEVNMWIGDGCGDIGKVIDLEPGTLAFTTTGVRHDENK